MRKTNIFRAQILSTFIYLIASTIIVPYIFHREEIWERIWIPSFLFLPFLIYYNLNEINNNNIEKPDKLKMVLRLTVKDIAIVSIVLLIITGVAYLLAYSINA